MSIQIREKNTIEQVRTHNVGKLLEWKKKRRLDAIKNAFGILKLKKTGVQIQREMRKDRKIKELK